MASLVLGIGSSHSIMLMATAEDWPRFVEVDKARASYFDKAGRPTNYEGLLATADKEIEQRLHPDALRALYQNCQANLEKLRETIRRVVPDIIVIIGDDQKEMFLDDNLPAFLVYWGKQIVNRPTARREAWDWYTEARRRYCETEPRAFPVAAGLAEHMVAKLMEASFDVAQSSKQPENVSEGEGHAFAFARQRLMPDKTIPIVPVFINAYYPPNQPSSRRCFDFGRALCRAIESWPEPARVAIIGTGGLSHFTLDEQFDRGLLDAFRDKDEQTIASVSAAKLKSGSGEIRNWIALGGAIESLKLQWSDYVPCYRSPAGTGTGLAFAVWE